MSSRSQKSTSPPQARPCPQGCGFSLHEKDYHEACPVCLGIVHARRALTQPDACAFCRQLRRSTLERRVKFVEKTLGQAVVPQDPLLSQAAEHDPGDGLEPSFGAAASWADQMESLSEMELAHSPVQQLECLGVEDDGNSVLDLGLDEHGLSDDEQLDMSGAQGSPANDGNEVDNSFFALYRRAARKLDVEWPAPLPAQRPTRFAGFFLPQAPTVVRHCLPLFPDFVTELTSSWNKPLSTRASLPGFAQFLEHADADKAGLITPPPMEPSLAAYLAPSHNHGVVGPTSLPSKHCRFSYAQLEKSYRAQATTARAMSSISLLQTYQAMCLAELADMLPPDRQEGRIGFASASETAGSRDTTSADLGKTSRSWSTEGRREREEEAKFVLTMAPTQTELSFLGDNAALGADQSSPPAGRLALQMAHWRACAISPWVESTLSLGYRLQFRRRPPRFKSVVQTTMTGEGVEVNSLLSKKAICIVPHAQAQCGWYSRYFVIPKRSGGLRPILDLRSLNKHLRVYKFRMLTVRQLLNSVKPGQWFTSIDLTDAFQHVSVLAAHRKFLRFAFQGISYEYLVLPYGLALSPRVFTKVLESALAPLRARGIQILAYLDDMAIVSHSEQSVATHTAMVLSHLQTLGFSVNYEKSSLTPRQKIEFLGLEICSLSGRAFLAVHRRKAFRECLAQFRLGHKLRFQMFLRLLGLMASMIAVIPLGLLHMRAFQRWVLSHRLNTSRHLNKRLTVDALCQTALAPWTQRQLLHQGAPIGRILFRKVITTDASLRGWGAICEDRTVRGEWSLSQSSLHINHLELLTVFLALKHFLPALQGHHVLVRTDNSTVVSYINRQGGTHSLPLLKLSRSLLLWSQEHLQSVRATHVPGSLNQGADLLSRGGPLVREWRLHPKVVSQIWDRFGRADVDLFASKENTHCPLFFSMRDSSAPLGVDALAHSWPTGLLYAFPPVELIMPTLERVRQDKLSLILVAPYWPAKPWHAEIISLLAEEPWPLPLRRDLLSQAGGEILHPRPELWRLQAYRLNGLV
ncbi:uncharacterized protein LOC134075064 [Sardina pilchardus]|uniref:uncharacterized protein LOC134075064 n=1 Tax=Sardina pilchardus TaxID=27697 RepID=UPI002E1349DE